MFAYSENTIQIVIGLAFMGMAVVYFLWRQPSARGRIRVGNTSTLEMYARDLTQLARADKLDPVIGRHDELERVIQILCRRTKNNPVLVGKAGVGKTAIAEGLAQAIVKDAVPPILRNKRILALDLPALLAGTKYRGEFEQRLKRIADEITAAQRNIILFIDEIHTLAEAGGAEGAVDADDILKPALARGDLQVIGATTAEEYKQYIQKDVTLDRRLHPVAVDEPSVAETTEILRGIKQKYEDFHQVVISEEAIQAAVAQAEEFLPAKSFPDKAIDLMDEAASKVSIGTVADPAQRPTVTKAHVAEVIKEWLADNIE